MKRTTSFPILIMQMQESTRPVPEDEIPGADGSDVINFPPGCWITMSLLTGIGTVGRATPAEARDFAIEGIKEFLAEKIAENKVIPSRPLGLDESDYAPRRDWAHWVSVKLAGGGLAIHYDHVWDDARVPEPA